MLLLICDLLVWTGLVKYCTFLVWMFVPWMIHIYRIRIWRSIRLLFFVRLFFVFHGEIFTYIIAHAKSRNCMSDTVNTILISFPWLLFNISLNYRMYITVTTPYSHKIDFSSLEITLHRGLHHSHFNSGDLQQINLAIRFRHIPTFGAGLIENHAFV